VFWTQKVNGDGRWMNLFIGPLECIFDRGDEWKGWGGGDNLYIRDVIGW